MYGDPLRPDFIQAYNSPEDVDRLWRALGEIYSLAL